jgi:S1-C subfamily serine protease
MATGGLVLEDLADAQRLKTKLGTRNLALLVKHVGQYGEHAVAKRAGFQKGDIIVEVPGLRGRSSETDYLARILASKMRGDSMMIGVLRRGRRLELRLRLQ